MMRSSLLFFLLAILATTVPAASQEESESAEEAPFLEVLDVEIVNVDVWVTDRKGQPVTGLTREDFVVRRDGEPVELTNFYAVEDGRPTIPSVVPETDGGPPRPRTRLAPLAEEHRLWLVVYVDNFNLEPLHRRRVFPDVRAFLGRVLGPGDRGMIVSYDRSLEVRQPFTESTALLSDALAEVEKESAHAVVRVRERKETLHRLLRADSEGEALGLARIYADAQMNEVVFTTRALDQLVDTLAGLPGRKVLLYVTSGVPMRAGEEMFSAVAERWSSSIAYAEIPRHDTTRDFERIARRANANRVVFHTMDAGGMRGMMFGAAEYGDFLLPGMRSAVESAALASQQASLRLLAQQTGGRAIVNRNEILPALMESAVDFRTFYSLGISSSGADEGRFHRIEVEVERRGVRVRHRQGYRTQSADGRMIERLRSALLYDHRENGLGLTAEWGRPELDGDAKSYVVPVRLRIPLEDVVLLPTLPDRFEMRLKLYVGVVDSRGDMSEVDSVPLGLRIASEHAEAAQEEAFVYTHRLRIERGRHNVALAVRDLFGQRSSIVSRMVGSGE